MIRAPRPAAGRGVLALAALLALATAGLVRAASVQAPSPGEMSLGNPRAPITVIEYASVGCPHCAVWANDVFPLFRRKYIDTGEVRFVLREMITGDPALAAAGFLVARCAGPDKYFQVVDDVFASQDDLARDDGVDALAKIAEHAGLSRAKFDACLNDPAALAALNKRTHADAQAHGVTGTPTFFVNEHRLDGDQTLEDLDVAIAVARASRAKR